MFLCTTSRRSFPLSILEKNKKKNSILKSFRRETYKQTHTRNDPKRMKICYLVKVKIVNIISNWIVSFFSLFFSLALYFFSSFGLLSTILCVVSRRRPILMTSTYYYRSHCFCLCTSLRSQLSTSLCSSSSSTSSSCLLLNQHWPLSPKH